MLQPYYPHILAVIIGYFFGTIHPAYYFGKKVKNIDIRDYGSNNSGASNTVMTLGFKYGAAVAVIDALKGLVAALTAYYLITATRNTTLLYLGGEAAILGHLFPYYMGFRGGKGLATIIGFSFAVSPLLGLALIAILFAMSFISDYIVVGTTSVCIAMVIYTVYTYGISSPAALFTIPIVIIMLIKHRTNYRQIHDHTEPSFSGALFKKKDK